MDNLIYILDNGAYTAKVGSSADEDPLVVPNCIMKAKSERRRAFIGKQLEDCRDASGLFYMLAFQKGYIVNWDVQKTVWDHIFSPECSGINLSERILILTEPQFNFQGIQEAMTEIFFEEYECDAIHRTTAADLSAFHYFSRKQSANPYCIVVDMGYSFTHIIPFIKGKRCKKAIRRISMGGKLLTNHLKELISYRHLNVMDESYVVNQIKEDTCFVAEDFTEEMVRLMRKVDTSVIQEYVLPDFTTVNRGYVRKQGEALPEQQTIRLGNERFTVPELLFNPSDVGIQEMGVAETIIDCLRDCPWEVHHLLLSNIIVVGGCALFPGMQKRIYREVRALAQDDMEVNVTIADDPISYSWVGGKLFSTSANFMEEILTREEYEENGVQMSIEKFDL